MSYISTSANFRKKNLSVNAYPLCTLFTQSNHLSNITEPSFPYAFDNTLRTFNSTSAMKTCYDASIQKETDELTSFYQARTSSRNRQQKPSKEEKSMFYTKYNIKKPSKNIQMPNNKRPYALKVSIPSNTAYFSTFSKAIKTLGLNEQIVKQVHRLNSQYQIDCYCSNINHIEEYRNQLSKMPKVRVQKLQNFNKGNNFMQKALFDRRKTEIIPFLKISRDMFMNNDIKLNVSKINDIKLGTKPTSRAMFSMNIFGNECFIFGGMNGNYLSDMWVFNFSSHQWNKVNCEENPVGRCNHSAVIINDSIIIYGGTHPMNAMKSPEDILLFNLYSKQFSPQRIVNVNQPKKRKGHIGVSVGQTMLIHGGYDEENDKMLNSSYIITMPKITWNELIIEDNVELPYLAYHSAQVISDYDKKAMDGEKYTIYKPPSETIKNLSTAMIKYKGIYIFGGLMPNNKMNDDIYVITIGKIPCNVFKLKTKGIGPAPRINCGMVYIPQLNSFIIHGGENKVRIFNDLFILDIETFTWKKPINSNELLPRTEHKLFYNDGKVLILGGRNDKLYLKMDLESIDFYL